MCLAFALQSAKQRRGQGTVLMMAGTLKVYTIGHSDHPIAEFIQLLNRHKVTLVIDVRSQPYSQWAPQHNRESLARSLQGGGIRYLFMGDSLGGRPADRSLYEPGEESPNYGLVAQVPAYRAGIEQVLRLATAQHVVILCSEGDHTKCHRSMLIAPSLLQQGARVLHIRPDSSVVEEIPQPKQLTLF
jgi:uncharacterized protein (DUF488 family)